MLELEEEDIELVEVTSSEEHANTDDIVLDLNSAEIEPLPCENPVLDRRGVAEFGSKTDFQGKLRSVSLNRIEFPNLSSTLKPFPSPSSSESSKSSNMVWEEGQWTGFKLNCHKKKKRVECLIELYDKDCVNSVQDKDIYREKLD